MTEIEEKPFSDDSEMCSAPAKPKKDPLLETWFCVHCQRAVPKKDMVVYDGARVCRDHECARVVVLEDRYRR